MKILLFGKNGQVGRRLSNVLLPLGELKCFGSSDLNLNDFDKIKHYIKLENPDFIINAAAYTQVDKAETEHELAFRINAEAVKIIAEEASKVNAWLIHYSTDYVFDGTKNGEYTENDKTNPINIYGKSKLAGDNYVSSINAKHIILRTSWVFDSLGQNFPKTILKLAKNNDSLRVIDDQLGSPTNASFIANVTALIIYNIAHSRKSSDYFKGVYNLSSSGRVSWYEFAKALIKEANNKNYELKCLPENIKPIKTEDYPTAAKRPMNSKLDTMKLSNKFGLAIPSWNVYVESLIEELNLMNII